MKKLALLLIGLYQRVLSPDRGVLRPIYPFQGSCTMYPSCSAYMAAAIEKYGLSKGIMKGSLRIFRCNPFQRNLVDLP